MQLQLAAFLLPLISLTAAAPLEERIPLIAGFTLSTYPTCPYPTSGPTTPPSVSNVVLIAYGGACGKCVSQELAPNVGPYKLITNTFVDPKCTITLFQKADCSDPGIVSGPNCWTPEGGIRGYKVACPWWPENPPPGSLKPCSTPA